MVAPIVPHGLPTVLAKITSALWQDFRSEQQAEAERILQAQISRGKPWRLAEKESVAALFTYMRAAQEGTASRNLQLIAEALVTAAEEPTFAPDEFRRHATRLADLSREEILITAEFIRCRRAPPVPPAPKETKPIGNAEIHRMDDGAEDAQKDGQIWNLMRQSLLAKPAIFPNAQLLFGYAGALARTGWISYIGGWDDGFFRATPLLDAVERLVEWREAAARAEAGE